MSNSFHLRIFLALLLLAGTTSCRSRKPIVETGAGELKPLQDRSVQELLDRLDSAAFKSDWINAKASVSTVQDGSETTFNISLRGRRDSLIWISISPLLGIEVARVMITPDSVKFLNRLQGRYQAGSFESISRLLQLKVNFEAVQALVYGNFFAYKKNENRFNSVYLEDKYYVLSSLNKKKLKRSLEERDPNKPVIQDISIHPSSFRILKMTVEDQKIDKTLSTEYDDFREVNGGSFPFRSTTRVEAEKELIIRIEFGKVTAGEPQEFPFNIPANYVRMR
ncbi:MAG: hypothetical protein RLZZ630_1847 [Bacteroidota bacterium]|jgi:hypothetical protein